MKDFVKELTWRGMIHQMMPGTDELLNKEQLSRFLDFDSDAPMFPSKGEMRTLVKGGGVSINKEKLTDANYAIQESDLLDGKYILAQQGKKKYCLVIVK